MLALAKWQGEIGFRLPRAKSHQLGGVCGNERKANSEERLSLRMLDYSQQLSPEEYS